MKIEQIFEKFLTGDRCRWYDSRRKGAARMPDRTYLAIDLKSFYASVECAARGLDPLKTNLVVADEERTEKTICLAVSPPLKAYGIGGRARLFEVNERVRQVNAERRQRAPGRTLTGSSCDADALAAQPELALDFIIARPRMALYMQVSTQIYRIYLKYIAPEDIHVYSIDEVPEAEDALRLIRNAGRVSSFCNDVIGDICGVISGSAAAVISARVLLLSKSGSEIFITLLLSAVVSGMTVGGKACGKSLAMNSSTAVVRTAAKVLCFFRTLPQRLEKKSAKK